jgi:hypothetical protein
MKFRVTFLVTAMALSAVPAPSRAQPPKVLDFRIR